MGLGTMGAQIGYSETFPMGNMLFAKKKSMQDNTMKEYLLFCSIFKKGLGFPPPLTVDLAPSFPRAGYDRYHRLSLNKRTSIIWCLELA